MLSGTEALRWADAAAIAEDIVAPWKSVHGPGGAILAFDTDDIRVEACGGLESLATEMPFSPDSVVRYASVTKHFLATMVMRHAAVIGLDDPLGKHLPGLKAPMADVTVGRALDMTGGLPDVRESLSLLGLSVHTATDAPELLEFLYRDGTLNFAPGTEISYSNTGYRLVEAALLAKGLDFNDWIGTEIAEPLGIELQAPETWYDPVLGLVPGYWQSNGAWKVGVAGLHLSASGSLTGSARHLARWLQTVLANDGPGRDVLKTLSAQRFLSDGRPTAYGLGMAWSSFGGRRFVGHGGSHAGYKTYFLLDPEHKAGVVLVSNREDTTSFGLAQRVMAALANVKLPMISRAIPDGLYATEEGPFWLRIASGVATFLGTGETLYEGPDGWSISQSAHFPMRLRWTGTAIEGEIGHAAHRFLPVVTANIPEGIAGLWINAREHAAFDIEANGTDAANLSMGTGPARISYALHPLGGNRVLMEGQDGPWAKQASLVFNRDEVTLALNRSRQVKFQRSREN